MFAREADYKKYFAIALLLGIGVFLAYLLRIFLLAVFGAYVFSFLFAPLYIWLNKKIGNDKVAALLTIFLILVIALAPLLLICYTAFNQALALQDKFNPQDFSALFERFNPKVRAVLDQALLNLTRDLSMKLTDALPSVFAAVTSLAVSLFVMFFVLYYIFLNIHYVFARSLDFLPFKQSNAIWLVRQFEHISKAILLGQILVSCIQGLLGGIGFFLFGLPNAVLWGIVMAVASLVPAVGTSLVWLPAVVYLLAHKYYFAGFGLLLWSAILVSNIDNFVRPRLGQRLGDINPTVMVLGAFSGLAFFGIVGVMVGPLLLAFFLLLVQVYRQEYLGHPGPLDRTQVLLTPSDPEIPEP
jgi:predicted PurR-regulated permease PerM